MSTFISVMLLILVTLIVIALQTSPGLFLLLYHYALGKKDTKHADKLGLSFILGAETSIAAGFLLTYFLIFLIFLKVPDFDTGILLWIMAGIFLGESIASFFFYFRKGPGTTLFLSRSIAKGFKEYIVKASKRSDAFFLGFISNLPEIIFTYPLYIILSIELMKVTSPARIFVLFSFIIISASPLYFILTAFHANRNLADIQRFRSKTKPIVRATLSLSFLLLSLILITFLGVNYG